MIRLNIGGNAQTSAARHNATSAAAARYAFPPSFSSRRSFVTSHNNAQKRAEKIPSAHIRSLSSSPVHVTVMVLNASMRHQQYNTRRAQRLCACHAAAHDKRCCLGRIGIECPRENEGARGHVLTGAHPRNGTRAKRRRPPLRCLFVALPAATRQCDTLRHHIAEVVFPPTMLNMSYYTNTKCHVMPRYICRRDNECACALNTRDYHNVLASHAVIHATAQKHRSASSRINYHSAEYRYIAACLFFLLAPTFSFSSAPQRPQT